VGRRRGDASSSVSALFPLTFAGNLLADPTGTVLLNTASHSGFRAIDDAPLPYPEQGVR
jgi:hypothetical protein